MTLSFEERFEKAQQCFPIFGEQFKKRFPGFKYFLSDEAVRDNSGPYGARVVLTKNDVLNKIDTVVHTDYGPNFNVQLKTTETNNIRFDIDVYNTRNGFRFIEGSYIDGEKGYVLDLGDVDMIAFYMYKYDRVYIFTKNIIEGAFRSQNLWRKCKIYSDTKNVTIDIDTFMEFYNKCFNFFTYGFCTESEPDSIEGAEQATTTDDNGNIAA